MNCMYSTTVGSHFFCSSVGKGAQASAAKFDVILLTIPVADLPKNCSHSVGYRDGPIPSCGIDEIIEHEHAARDLDQGAAFIDRTPARGTAMAQDDGGGRAISALERGRDVLEAVPAFARSAAKRHTLDNRLETGRHRYAARPKLIRKKWLISSILASDFCRICYRNPGRR